MRPTRLAGSRTTDGCPKEPTWQIQADQVVYDSARKRVRYTNAKVRLFGIAIIPLPGLRHSIGDEVRRAYWCRTSATTGSNGFEAKIPIISACRTIATSLSRRMSTAACCR